MSRVDVPSRTAQKAAPQIVPADLDGVEFVLLGSRT